MSQRFNESDFDLFSSRTIFFDANIIIDVFWSPHIPKKSTKKLSSVFSKLIINKTKLVTSSIVISEIINRMIRLEMTNIKNYTSEKYKEFREKKEGKEVVKRVFVYVENKILPVFEIADKQFSSEELRELIEYDNLCDFNDKLIYSNCKTNKFVLFSNDSDFSLADIDVLSTNAKTKNNQP